VCSVAAGVNIQVHRRTRLVATPCTRPPPPPPPPPPHPPPPTPPPTTTDPPL
jgi:hypothetical protein